MQQRVIFSKEFLHDHNKDEKPTGTPPMKTSKLLSPNGGWTSFLRIIWLCQEIIVSLHEILKTDYDS